MSKIVIGSLNTAKVEAVRRAFPDDEVMAKSVDSGVSEQPKSDEETLRGAINRAKNAKQYGDIGIGLEGGVSFTPYGLFLINYGALIDENDHCFVAGGLRIPLPDDIKEKLEQGMELGDVMDQFTKKKGVKHDEGAIGVFTANNVKRGEMFEQLTRVLKGQYQFGNTFSGGNNNDPFGIR